MAYDFYFDKLLLPVPPKKLEIKIRNNNKTLTLADDSEINVLKKAGLTDIKFAALIPQVKYPFAKYISGFQGAKYFLDAFEGLKISQKPFQFIVARTMPTGKVLFNSNIAVSLEDYGIEEGTDEGFDVVVPFNLKQYQHYGTKELEVVKTKPTATEVKSKDAPIFSPEVNQNQWYRVAAQDTLSAIAKRFYGDSSKYSFIAKANNLSNPNNLEVGQQLTIPKV